MNVIFLFFFIGTVLEFMAISIISPFYPPLANKKNVSDSMIGLIFSIHPIGEFIASLIIGKKMNNVLLFWGAQQDLLHDFRLIRARDYHSWLRISQLYRRSHDLYRLLPRNKASNRNFMRFLCNSCVCAYSIDFPKKYWKICRNAWNGDRSFLPRRSFIWSRVLLHRRLHLDLCVNGVHCGGGDSRLHNIQKENRKTHPRKQGKSAFQFRRIKSEIKVYCLFLSVLPFKTPNFEHSLLPINNPAWNDLHSAYFRLVLDGTLRFQTGASLLRLHNCFRCLYLVVLSLKPI